MRNGLKSLKTELTMDKTLKLNELYRKITLNRRSDMSDEQFNNLLNDLYLMGFNDGAYENVAGEIPF